MHAINNQFGLRSFYLFHLFITPVIFVTGVAHASINWGQPPADRTQDLLNHDMPKDFLKEMRRGAESNSGFVPKQNYLFVKGVRTGSGGGGGIACFESDEAAETVLDLYTTRRVKKGADLSKIKWLVTFDAVVKSKTKDGGSYIREDMILPNAGESSMDYLQRILDTRIGRINPEFAQRLREVIFTKVHPAKWYNRPGLPVQNDNSGKNDSSGVAANLIVQLQGCPAAWYVQLAVRHQLIEKDVIAIDADYSLIARMHQTLSPQVATLYEALLVVHEALYFMIMRNGTANSYPIQQLSGDLLSVHLDKKMLAIAIRGL